MVVVGLLLVIVVVGVTVAVAAGHGDRLEPASVDRVPSGLPRFGPVTSDDVSSVRFNLGLRGYRMDEVDWVLERLAAELSDRETRVTELESRLAQRGTSAHMTLPSPDPEPILPGQPDEIPPLPVEPDTEPPAHPMPGEQPPESAR